MGDETDIRKKSGHFKVEILIKANLLLMFKECASNYVCEKERKKGLLVGISKFWVIDIFNSILNCEQFYENMILWFLSKLRVFEFYKIKMFIWRKT